MMAPNSLSEFANRIAKVCASGSPSLTSAATFQTQLRSLPTLGESFISGVTAGSQYRVTYSRSHSLTVVVGTDFESLVSSHDQTSLAVLFVL